MDYKEFVFAGAGKRQFTLSEDSISVAKGDTLLLKGLEPEYRTVRQRSPALYVGLIAFFLGLVFFGYGLVFDSEDMAEMRSQASFQRGVGLLNRQVTVQVGEEEPLTGVVKMVHTGDGEPQLTINSQLYALQDVIHVKADRTDLFALAVISGALGLLILVSSWRKVEHAIFKNTTGVDAISIARAGPDSSRFDLFVDELSRRIRQAENEEGDGVD